MLSAVRSALRKKLKMAVRRVSLRLDLAQDFFYDLRRFAAHSATLGRELSAEQARNYIRMLSHSLEKGLALPRPRAGFGKKKAADLIGRISNYLEKHGDHSEISDSICVLLEYCTASFLSMNDTAELIGLMQSGGLSSTGNVEKAVATRTMTAEEIILATNFDAEMFFRSRSSVRQFGEGSVNEDVLLRAIQMAQLCPSVCNRQSARVHIFRNGPETAKILEHQHGNSGFGSDASHILLITSELGAFFSSEERYQAWIDGGMFAMSLIYALHANRVASCCLNWSSSRNRDVAMRRSARIPASETIIMLMAVGNYREHFTVAGSPRKSLSDVVSMHGGAGE